MRCRPIPVSLGALSPSSRLVPTNRFSYAFSEGYVEALEREAGGDNEYRVIYMSIDFKWSAWRELNGIVEDSDI